MKITIYVHEDYLESMCDFTNYAQPKGKIEWYHDRPNHLEGRFYMVTISYNDYVRLKDLK